MILRLCFFFLFSVVFLSTDAKTSVDTLSVNQLKVGKQYLSEEEYNLAATHFEKGIKLYETAVYDTITAQLSNNLGIANYYQGNVIESIKNYELAKTLYERFNLFKALAETELNLGVAYKKIGAYEKAYYLLLSSVSFFEKTENIKSLSSAYNSLGNVYKQLNDYEQSISFYRKALEVRTKLDYKKGIASTLHNIGQLYLLQEQTDSAKKYLYLALKIKHQLPKEIALSSTESQLSLLYSKSGQLDSALMYAKRSLNKRETVNSNLGIATSLLHIANIYTLKEQYKLADSLLTKAFHLAEKDSATTILLDIAEVRIALSQRLKNSDAISYWYQLYSELKDRLVGIEKQEAVQRLRIEFEVEKNPLIYTALLEYKCWRYAIDLWQYPLHDALPI